MSASFGSERDLQIDLGVRGDLRSGLDRLADNIVHGDRVVVNVAHGNERQPRRGKLCFRRGIVFADEIRHDDRFGLGSLADREIDRRARGELLPRRGADLHYAVRRDIVGIGKRFVHNKAELFQLARRFAIIVVEKVRDFG